MKGAAVGIIAYVGKRWDVLLPLLVFLLLLMLLEYTSNILAYKKEQLDYPNDKKYMLDRKQCLLILYKKIGCLITVTAAVFLDYLIVEVVDKIGISYNDTMISIIVIAWLSVNEMLSVLDNTRRMGVQLPEFFVKILQSLKSKIDKKEE